MVSNATNEGVLLTTQIHTRYMFRRRYHANITNSGNDGGLHQCVTRLGRPKHVAAVK